LPAGPARAVVVTVVVAWEPVEFAAAVVCRLDSATSRARAESSATTAAIRVASKRTVRRAVEVVTGCSFVARERVAPG
jgi:glutamate-1-semialdehyde aminotransferase